MLRYLTLGLCALLWLAAMPLYAQEALPPPINASICGIVTIMQPDGQFYTDVGRDSQLYNGAGLRIFRDGVEIARAKVVHVGRLDSIANLLAPYRGTPLQAGDAVLVYDNPVPLTPPKSLPCMQPDPSMRRQETSFGAFLIVAAALIVF